MASERLSRYKCLIANMPLFEHASYAKKSIWEQYEKANPILSETVSSFSNENGWIVISRRDLFRLATQGDKQRFIFATYIWGYPNGGRGKHFSNVVRQIETISGHLQDIQGETDDWKCCTRWMNGIRGLGISTYTKLLYFMRASIKGNQALILDSRVAKVFKRKVFPDFKNLRAINMEAQYPEYLCTMGRISEELHVEPDKLEMFLFTFGSAIKAKPAAGQ